jgi:predicted nucleic acid-binding protein
MSMTVTFDSSAWIEYFSGSKLGQLVKEYIDKQETIYTPSIALLEIKNKYQRENRKWKSRIDFIYEQSSIIDLDHKIALLGADMKKEHGLYSIDAIIYASARSIKSKLLTKDRHFKGLKNVIILE